MLFVETASGDEKGEMLTLFDYHRWLPGFTQEVRQAVKHDLPQLALSLSTSGQLSQVDPPSGSCAPG